MSGFVDWCFARTVHGRRHPNHANGQKPGTRLRSSIFSIIHGLCCAFSRSTCFACTRQPTELNGRAGDAERSSSWVNGLCIPEECAAAVPGAERQKPPEAAYPSTRDAPAFRSVSITLTTLRYIGPNTENRKDEQRWMSAIK